MNNPKLDADRQKIVDACHHDPFSVLGKHTVNKRTQVRVYIPYAEKVAIVEGNLSMRRIQGTDIFEW